MKENSELEKQLTIDTLTKINNRSAFEYDVKEFMEIDPLSLILFDIDSFKEFNEENGVNSGDEVLYSLAQFSQRAIGENAKIYRWSGEQFVIIYRDKSIDEGEELADKLRKLFENELHPGNT